MSAEIIMLKDYRIKQAATPPVTSDAKLRFQELQLEHDMETYARLTDAELDEFRFIFGQQVKP